MASGSDPANMVCAVAISLGRNRMKTVVSKSEFISCLECDFYKDIRTHTRFATSCHDFFAKKARHYTDC